MVITPTIRTAPHANHPFRIRHLVVYLADSGSHLVRHRPGDNEYVRLSWGGTEEGPSAVEIVARHPGVHHFDAAAGEAES